MTSKELMIQHYLLAVRGVINTSFELKLSDPENMLLII